MKVACGRKELRRAEGHNRRPTVRKGGREMLSGNKEKALNLHISPTEAKPTLNQPQLGAAGACE